MGARAFAGADGALAAAAGVSRRRVQVPARRPARGVQLRGLQLRHGRHGGRQRLAHHAAGGPRLLPPPHRPLLRRPPRHRLPLNGVNFAIAGSTTLPRDVLFALHVQVQEFMFFKARSLELISQGQQAPIDAEGFENALYTIDIGQNDVNALLSNLPYDQVVAKFPPILAEIKDAVQTLYFNGSRNFWIHGTGALGCLPQKLAIPRKNDSDLDQNGCLNTYNRAAVAFNAVLGSLCDQLNVQMKDATIVYTDLFAIKYDLVANHTKYGFDSPLMTCCGYGGPPYNYDLSRSCQSPNATVCADGSKFISWDGVHLTEAANAIVAAGILSSAYSKPNLKFDQFCKV
ncbi:hypothetical protein BRADI_2g12340v3 [Brachypodium distachyon]|uniref:Uncharacterized protein n=1 Tax=Brachypodium distachyon TaxID=15368 RepID=A0A2K2D858_BRADI|nr:hypothetical protein BRADI_2g12340v3 [Brachypodium distachyon]